jgi:hypothetical protein
VPPDFLAALVGGGFGLYASAAANQADRLETRGEHQRAAVLRLSLHDVRGAIASLRRGGAGTRRRRARRRAAHARGSAPGGDAESARRGRGNPGRRRSRSKGAPLRGAGRSGRAGVGSTRSRRCARGCGGGTRDGRPR